MTIDDRELDRRLSALPRQVEAPRALWDGIEQRIDTGWRWPALGGGLAAAVGALALVAVVIVNGPLNDVGFSPMAVVVSSEVEVMARIAPRPEPVIASDVNDGWSVAWSTNQQAIGELEAALEHQPENRDLLDHLVRARHRQADLVRVTL